MIECLKAMLIIGVISLIIGILASKFEAKRSEKELQEYTRYLEKIKTMDPSMLSVEAESNHEQLQELKKKCECVAEAAVIMIALWACYTEGIPATIEYFSFDNGIVSNTIHIIVTIIEYLLFSCFSVGIFAIIAIMIAFGIERFSDKFAFIITIALMFAMLFFC